MSQILNLEVLLIFAIILMILCVYQFIKISNIQKELNSSKQDIAKIANTLGGFASIEATLDMASTIDSNFDTIFAQLDYVTDLAENANKYAHIHN